MLVSSQTNLAGIRVKSKRAASSQSYGKLFSVRSLLQNVLIMKDERRFLIEVRLKKLNSTAIWAFVLVYTSPVTVSLPVS